MQLTLENLPISSPTPQLLMETPDRVQAQFQFMKIAVWQLLKVKLRVVYCCEPKKAPYLPPLKVKSVMNPPEPLSMKMPTCLFSSPPSVWC